MDLIKKAKKSALALKSEVQGIISAPGQQPGSYQSSSSPSFQAQSYQQQYTYGQQPLQPYVPGQQSQYLPGNHAPLNQYSPQQPQYGQNPQPPHSHMSPNSQSQYQPVHVHNLIAPPWSPPVNNQQSQTTGSFQSQYPPHQNPASTPLYQTPSQSYQQPVNSPSPQGQFQAPGHQIGSPPIQQFNQTQFMGPSPPIPQPYSTPSAAQSAHQQTPVQQGYFPQSHQPNQASNFMQNFHSTQNQAHGPQSPSMGRPLQAQSSFNPGSQTPPLPPRQDTLNHSQPQMHPPNQTPPPYSPPAPTQGQMPSTHSQISSHPQHQSYSQPPYSQQQYPVANFSQPSESPNQTVSSYPSPGSTEGQARPPHQYSSPPPQQTQQEFIRTSQSPSQMAPPYSTPGPNVNSSQVQAQAKVSSQIPTASRFSPRPVQGHMPPPRQDSPSYAQQTLPLQQPNRSQTSGTSHISPQTTGGQMLPPQHTTPSPVLHQQQNSQGSVSIPPPYSAPKPVPVQGQGQIPAAHTQGATPSPRLTQSRPPSQTSQISSTQPSQSQANQAQKPPRQTPSPAQQYQTFSQIVIESPSIAPVPLQPQSKPNLAQEPSRETVSPPPVKQYQVFSPTPPGPSLQPAPLNTNSSSNKVQKPLRETASPPPTQQYQTFNHQIESPSLKPAPLNTQSTTNRTHTPPIKATSPPPLNQSQPLKQTTAQVPSPDPLFQRPPPTVQGRASSPPQNQSQGQYKAFRRISETPSQKPAPLYSQPQQTVAPRQDAASPAPVKEYQAFNQRPQSPPSNFTAFKPPTPKGESGQVSPLKSNSPVPQNSPLSQIPAPTIPQAPYPHDQQLPYRVSPQSEQSRPVYGHQQSFQMPAPPQGQISHSGIVSPPIHSHDPHSGMISPPPQSHTPYSGVVSPVSPTHKTHSFPPQVFELDSGHNVPSVPQGRPSFPSTQSGAIEFADGLISVEHEESNHQPVIRNKPSHQAPVAQKQPLNNGQAGRETTHRLTKIKCTGFESTLSDANQFFQLHPAIISQYSIPPNPMGDFVLCEYCYHNFILPHPWLASSFHPRPKGPQPDKGLPISFEKIAHCGFALPRVRQVILGQTIPQKNVLPFMEYMRLDATLPPCSGGPKTGNFYGSKAIESLVMCESCFEHYIKNTAFERNFALIQTAPGQVWGCDIGYSGYVQRTLLTDLAKNPPHFEHFAYETSKRLAMPPCTGHKQPIAVSGPRSSNIFRSVQDNQGVFCSAHFYDIVVGTPAERNFGYEIDIDDEQKEVLSCDLSFQFSQSAMKVAVEANTYQIWYRPIVASNTTQPCPSLAGHDEGELADLGSPLWYEFKDFPEIEVCARCYGMEIIVSQAESLFVPINRALIPGRIRQCYLSQSQNPSLTSFDPMAYENTTAWRGQYLRNIIKYCRDSGGDFTLAIEAAKMISCLPPPCGSEYRAFTKSSGRKWFGHQTSHSQDPNDATIIVCSECHDFCVKGTRLEGFMSNDLTNYAYSRELNGVRCSTWSKQCKLRLRDVCTTGDFPSYAQYHRRREEVYVKLWQSIREMDALNGLLKVRTGKNNRVAEMNVQMGGMRLDQHDTGGAAHDMVGNLLAGMGPPPPGSDAGNMPGLNLVMWEIASKERLSTEIERRMEVLNELREEWDHLC